MDEYEALDHQSSTARTLEESTAVLERLLSGGYAVWDDGSLYSIKQLVARINGLKIEVRSREHAPPHFHVTGGGVNASFAVADCSHLEGTIGGRERQLVEWWYKRSRANLVAAWNQSRPDGCPVGPIDE
ncbi:DUF4160 domain-containing protein [Duganella sp. FT3S]|uniref:DUF4160 domain-containing protein n=1 Tax=Rugamonas fusca TaxID=2758568 RepID=A0A7W2I967_9BURK|nr:DUF4160 domain-containing protein [Rugamonas fusca]MBA5608284.1 DUF4160 domain-containing protein [Rugamonas fusca]